MPDYRIGSLSLPGVNEDSLLMVVYFAKRPGGGEIEGELGVVIDAIEKDLQRLNAEQNLAFLKEWMEYFARLAVEYMRTSIEMKDASFYRAELVHVLYDDEPISYQNEDEFKQAIGLPQT